MELKQKFRNGLEALREGALSVLRRHPVELVLLLALTVTLLVYLERKGYLKYHHVRRPESRGAFLYAHATAVMTDKSTGVDWIADSWMRDSGDPIDVMPLETWFSLAYVDPVS